MHRPTMLFLLIGALVSSDCSINEPDTTNPSATINEPTTPSHIGRIDISGCLFRMSAGDSVEFGFNAYDAQGNWVRESASSITVADTTIARVTSHYTDPYWLRTWIVGLRPGATTFKLTVEDKSVCARIVVADGMPDASLCDTVLDPVDTVSVVLANDSGTAQHFPALLAAPFDARGNELTCRVIDWSVSDTNIVRLTGTEIEGRMVLGQVMHGGTVIITARSEGKTTTMTMTFSTAVPGWPYADVGSPGWWMAAQGMNDDRVVGFSGLDHDVKPVISHNGGYSAFGVAPATVVMPELLPGMTNTGNVGTANAINQHGIVAGVLISESPGASHTLTLWDTTGRRLSSTPLPNDSLGQFLVVKLNEQNTVLLGAESPGTSQGRKGLVVEQGVVHWLGHLNDSVPLTDPFAINLRGQVVGRGGWTNIDVDSDPDRVAFHPFIWDSGVLRDLGVFGRTTDCSRAAPCASGAAFDINDQGDIVGYAEDSSGLRRPVLWSNGQMIDLGVFPGKNAVARAINNRGQIAGDGDDGAFVWDHGTTVPVYSLGGGYIEVLAMNERGDIAGTALTISGEQHAFAFVDGRMHDFGRVLSDGCATQATAVNDSGDVLIVIQRWPGGGCQPRSDDRRLVDFGNVTHQRAMIWRNPGH